MVLLSGFQKTLVLACDPQAPTVSINGQPEVTFVPLHFLFFVLFFRGRVSLSPELTL